MDWQRGRILTTGHETMRLLTHTGMAAAFLIMQPPAPTREMAPMQAKGTFEVKVVPLAADEGTDTGGFGRLSIDKTFSGDSRAPARARWSAPSRLWKDRPATWRWSE